MAFCFRYRVIEGLLHKSEKNVEEKRESSLNLIEIFYRFATTFKCKSLVLNPFTILSSKILDRPKSKRTFFHIFVTILRGFSNECDPFSKRLKFQKISLAYICFLKNTLSITHTHTHVE